MVLRLNRNGAPTSSDSTELGLSGMVLRLLGMVLRLNSTERGYGATAGDGRHRATALLGRSRGHLTYLPTASLRSVRQ
eukprot:815555-Rhodomonas_salina.6